MTSAATQIRLDAFTMNCVGHINHGPWTHPRDRSREYNTLRYWTDQAKLLERGLFDGMFIADILGVHDIYGGRAGGRRRDRRGADPRLPRGPHGAVHAAVPALRSGDARFAEQIIPRIR